MSKIRSKRYFILFMAELLCLLLLLPGCFRREELVYDFYGEDIIEMTVPVWDHLEFYGDRLVLPPGVYEIRLQTRLTEGQRIYVDVKYDNAYFRSLRGNGVTVFSGDDAMDFSIYVLDKVPSAYVQCNFTGTGPESLLQLEIYRTNKGSRVVLFLAVVFFGALDFLIEFRRRILDGRITKRQQMVFWTLTAGVLIAYFPYLTDYFVAGTDTLFHVSRIAWLEETLKQGTTFPIRIQSHWNYDHGYAVSMFYGDLFLFIPAVLQLIGFSIMAAYKIFILIVLALTAVIAYWSFYKCIKDEYAALFGSVIYLLSPYHLLNVYNRGALGEALAAVSLPLICCGMYLLYTDEVKSISYTKYKWYIVIGISLLLQSHLISTEMTVIFMVLVCVVFWKKTFRKETFLQLLKATIIALLINMWFWLPLVYMMNADIYLLQSITSEPIQDSGVTLAGILQLLPNMGTPRKIGSRIGIWNSEPIQLGVGAMILLVVYILWRGRKQKQIYDKPCEVLAIFTILTIVLSTRYIPWDAVMKVPIIGFFASSLQFPSRWLVLSTLFVSLLAAGFYLQVKEAGGFYVKAALGVVAMLTVVSAVYHVNNIAYESAPFYLHEAENMGTLNVGRGEYLLEEVGWWASELYFHEPTAEGGLEWSDYRQNGTNADIFLNNRTEGVLHIEIPLIGYKGYGIEASEQTEEIPYITEEVGKHGDLRIAVPAGYQGKISISYAGFPFFHAAEAVSLISLATIICVYFYHKRKKIQDGNEYKADK